MREAQIPEIQPFVLGAGCTSAAGGSVAETWDGIVSGRSFVRAVPSADWSVVPRFEPRACLWSDAAPAPNGETAPALEKLIGHSLRAFREALAELSDSARERVRSGKSFGVILATTKGAIDDEIWHRADNRLESDSLTPVLDTFLRAAELSPARKTVLSNACASSLSAVALARTWLTDGDLDDVLVLAVDAVGPFILHGFHSLRAVTPEVARPFAANRSGLLLGEGSAALFLSRHPGPFRIAGVAVDGEGFAVTRPDESGRSLRAACDTAIAQAGSPHLVIAHGTATEVNDPIEARVLGELFTEAGTPITASKGAIGHTLAASGAIDLILAREAIRRAAVFPISQSEKIDSRFTANFLAPTGHENETIAGNYSRVLVCSLGFGGIHAAAILERSPESALSIIPASLPRATTLSREMHGGHVYAFPATSTPDWAPQVERWYQLDEAAFALADAAYRWRSDSLPDALFLASTGGSRVTDAAFVKGGARSPALFVHSLPNVRSSAFCQVLGWHGPITCIQNDPFTFESACEEALREYRQSGKSVWVVGLSDPSTGKCVRRFRIGAAS